MATRIDTYRQLARALYTGKFYPITGTASTTTSTTSLKDTTKLSYSSGDANAYDRKWVYGMQAADAATRGYSRVTEGGYSGANGTLALDPAITGLTGTDLYIITDDPPDVLQEAINAVLRNYYLPCFFPLSLHVCTSDENDMETAPATTFDGNKSNATLANESTIIYNGAQSLKVTAGATDAYTHFGNLGVNENESLYAAIMCYVTSGDSATFRIIDVTNSNATVEDATTDEVKWMDLIFPFTVPSGCEQIHARAISDANGDITYWDDYQIWRNGEGVYPLPSWITRPSQIIGVQAFPQGTGGPASDQDYRADEQRSRPLAWDMERVDRRATNELRIWVENPGSARPYIIAYRPLSALTTDTATTPLDVDTAAFWAKRLITDPDNAGETLEMLKAISLARPVRVMPRRVGAA